MTTLDSFEKELCDGNKPGTLFLKDYGDGTCVNMWLMDAEYDPIRIAYDVEGDVTIFADGHKWVCFSPDQLIFIADQSDEAAAMTGQYYDENPAE